MKELEQSEIVTLNAYRQVFDNIIRELGTVAIMQKDLNERKEKAEKALDGNRKGQQDYLNSLQAKYGEGELDLTRGLFIPAKRQQVEVPPNPAPESPKPGLKQVNKSKKKSKEQL